MRISNLSPRGARGALLAVLLSTTALAGFAAGHAGFAESTQPAPIQPTTPAQTLPDFSGLVSQVKPAVVSITSEMKPEMANDEQESSPSQSPFPFGRMQPRAPQGHMEARGSGFIVDPDGTIVTNNHVVQGAKSVSVTLDDGTKLSAHVVGRDPRTDLAVLRVKADHPLPYIRLGDSDHVKVGEWVVAMGNPFGLDGTVTAGIVSARGRDIGAGPYDNFLQVDAPINRGNSGGPLFTLDGRVVGVNTAILSPTGGSVGIGFAIPSNLVKTVIAQLETTGHVTRGYLGVSAQSISPAMAAALKLPKKTDGEAGALIAEVTPDSPAAKAGFKPGDVITSVNGKTIGNPRELAVAVAGVKPGDDAKIDVLHEGASRSMTVAVGSLPSEDGSASPAAGEPKASVGLALAPLSPEMRDQLDLPEHTDGAVVAQVKPGSPADDAGMQQGDVIVGVGTKAVKSADQAARAIREAAKDEHAVALRIVRDGHTAFVGIDMKKGADDSAG
jgi:serine protease Do